MSKYIVDFERDEYDSAASVLRIIDAEHQDHPQGPLVIADINVAACAPHLAEPLATAHLFAAAPDLLAVVESAACWFGELGNDDGAQGLLDDLRAAIAKATK
jgi:hypothetical protein